jgi:hypothetical protein
LIGRGGRGALLAAVLAVGILGPAVATSTGQAGAGTAGAALTPKVALPQAAPNIPPGTPRLGAPPPGRVLHLDATLAGRDPSGLAQAVVAVSTPGSPQYRQYLSPRQFAAEFGPSPAVVAQASSVLRAEGLTLGTPAAGSVLLPVSGTAEAVSSALGTPLEQVQAPDGSHAVVNTATPQVPASLAGVVTGVVGLDGLFEEHSMLRHRQPAAPGAPPVAPAPVPPSAPAPAPASAPASAPAQPHAGTPQACAAAAGAAPPGSGLYTSTGLSGIFGLDPLLSQGRTGVGQTIAIVEFEQYAPNDVGAFLSCYGLTSRVGNVLVDGGAGGRPQGSGEAALDIELASYNAPSAHIVVYEAPNVSDAQAFDLFNRIAGDDSARVVTTSWGNCEAQFSPGELLTEDAIFQRMALQGQTVIAAAGDAGSEDCYNPPAGRLDGALAVDDPGAQPDVVSAGGTALPTIGPAVQRVWNDCAGAPDTGCAATPNNGAGGGGYSMLWPRPSYQLGPNPHRAVPDFSYPADPESGGVLAYWDGGWSGFGGTSVAPPTDAGLFADTNQGCYRPLGMVGPALYAAGTPPNGNFTDVHLGENDFTRTNGGRYGAGQGFDPASGLGTPIDQNLSVTLQGGDGCPSVAALSPNVGPILAGGAITVFGGGLADATSVDFGAAGAGRIVSKSPTALTVVPPNAPGSLCVDVTVANPRGVSATSAADRYGFGGSLNCGTGYRFVASDGGVFSFGDANFFGSMGGTRLNEPIVGMATTPSTSGYFLVASDGGIFSFGDAQFYGSTGALRLNRPVVGMAATPDARGYWLVASDGGIFAFGDAQFYGSTGALHLNKPIVGMAATSDGRGYWLVASDGGIFAFGDAPFLGSAGALTLNSPVVGMTVAGPASGGYWLVAADGGIFSYGDAPFYGSAGGIPLNEPVVGLAGTPSGGGYWLVAADGGIFSYGDAPFLGSTGGLVLNEPIVGMASS